MKANVVHRHFLAIYFRHGKEQYIISAIIITIIIIVTITAAQLVITKESANEHTMFPHLLHARVTSLLLLYSHFLSGKEAKVAYTDYASDFIFHHSSLINFAVSRTEIEETLVREVFQQIENSPLFTKCSPAANLQKVKVRPRWPLVAGSKDAKDKDRGDTHAHVAICNHNRHRLIIHPSGDTDHRTLLASLCLSLYAKTPFLHSRKLLNDCMQLLLETVLSTTKLQLYFAFSLFCRHHVDGHCVAFYLLASLPLFATLDDTFYSCLFSHCF